MIDKIDHLREPVAPQVEASLKRLQLENTDLFVFHGCSKMEDWQHIAAPGRRDGAARAMPQGGQDALSRDQFARSRRCWWPP